MLIAATLLIVAAFQPAKVELRGMSIGGEWFVTAAVVAGVLAASSAWLIVRGRSGGWRGGVALIALAGIGGLITFPKLPTPHPGIGIGPAGPWALLGCGWIAIAGILLALTPGQRDVTSVAVGRRVPMVSAVIVLAVAGLLAAGTPGVVATVNTDATTSEREVPAVVTPELDGAQAWHTEARSAPPEAGSYRDAVATAGGLLVATSSGVRMLDARTGEERWHHYRYDWLYFRHDNTYFRGPDEGRTWDDSNLAVAEDGRVVAVNMTRLAEGDDTEADTRTLVFDTVSGQVLGETAGDRAIAIAGGLVLSTTEVFNRIHGGSGSIIARTPSGEKRWEHRLPEGCALGEAHDAPGERILAGVRCASAITDTPPHVLALAAATGELVWRWQPPEAGRTTIRQGPADTLLVQVRIGDNRNPEQSVFALNAANGKIRWQREHLRLQHDSARETNGDDLYWATLLWVGGTPVLAEMELTESRFVLTGLDAADGSTTWSRTLPEPWRIPYSMTKNPRMTGPVLGLEDGRLLAAGALATGVLKPTDKLAITTIDSTNGTTLNDTVVRGEDVDSGFRLLRTPATVVAKSEGSAIALS